jgi:hypothetical protein
MPPKRPPGASPGHLLRLLALFGAMQILNLWLGRYNAPGEWPWTYFFLLVLQLIFTVHCYGGSSASTRCASLCPTTRHIFLEERLPWLDLAET